MNKVTVVFSQEEIENMRAMRKSGSLLKEIAAVYGHSVPFISKIIREGRQKAAEGAPQIERETVEAIRMRNDGMTYKQISEVQHVSQCAIRARIIQYRRRGGIYKTLDQIKNK